MSSEEKDKQNQETPLPTQNEEIDSKENDSQVEAKSDKFQKKLLPKIFAVILIISVFVLIIIVADEVSGKNRLKNIFSYLQKKITALLNKEKNVKSYQQYLHSLNVKNNNKYNIYSNSNNLENSIINNENNDVSQKENKNANVISNDSLIRDIIDYDEMTEEQLIEAIDADFKRDCKYYNQDSPVDSMVVKPFITKIAIDKGYDKLMDKLCKKDCHPRNDHSNFSSLDSLAYATEQDSKKCLEVLVKNGADLNKEQEDGKNLLHSAAQVGNINFAKKLIKHGISINKETKDNKSPLYYAVNNNKHEMAFFLLICGAKKEENLRDEAKDFHMLELLAKGQPTWRTTEIQPEDNEWKEAYEYIKQGKLEELKELVKSGKDLFMMRVGGEPAPCIATNFHQYEILKYLINLFDCKNLVDEKTGRNALHYAVKQSDTKIVDLLLQNGFDVNSTDLYDYTPLHHSVYNMNSDCMIILLHHGADPDCMNLKKQTPLHLAIMADNIFAINIFLEEGANLNLQDFEGNTPLHYVAVHSSNKQILDILYKYQNKFDLNIKNHKGQTPHTINSPDCFDYYEKRYNLQKK